MHKAILFLFLLLSLGQRLHAQNKVTDGNFEDGTPFTDPTDIANQFQTFYPGKSMTYWTVTANQVDKHNKAHWGMGCPPSGLDHHIDINPNGRMEQTITGLTIGTTYNFNFWTSVHYLMATGCGAVGGTASATIRVGAMFSTTLTLTAADEPWAKRSYTFKATATSAVLSFEGISSCYGNGGILFDDVWIYDTSSATGVDCTSKGHFANAGKDMSYCTGQTGFAVVNLAASGGLTYAWSPAGLFTDPKLSSETADLNTSQRFVVTVTDKDGCVDQDTVDITVLPGPVVTIDPDTITRCEGARVQLKASGAMVYTWSPDIALDISDATDEAELIVSRAISRYVVKGTAANGCTGYDTLNIGYADGPDVRAWPKDTAACTGTVLNIHATGAARYSWYPPTGIYKDDEAETQMSIAATMSYVVTGTDSSGCMGQDTINVVAYPVPDVQATASGRIDCSGQPVTLQGSGAVSYAWEPRIYCDNPDQADTRARPPYTLVYTLTGTSDKGCTGTDTVTVFYGGPSKVNIPNAFTPNGDQLNDALKPLIVCNFKLTTFSVFNRWGQEVFTTNAINTAWDGTSRGMPCDGGVYFYLLRGKDNNDEEVLLKGDVTLIR